jgi:hypothetical protein
MNNKETCFCGKRTVEFRSEFKGDVVSMLYCPDCVDRAPSDAIIFELCEPGDYAGIWAMLYNKGELKRLDEHFRDNDAYYLSLLISGVCGPSIAREYTKTGLCRIFGFKHGADAARRESTLNAAEEAVAEDESLTTPLPQLPAMPKTKKKKAAAKKKVPVKKATSKKSAKKQSKKKRR